jgi:hemerythrin-like domain-containing protein
MSHTTLAVIRKEHAAFAAMLRTLQMLLAEHRKQGSLPDFSVLRAMLFYVDEFPEKRHHRKESELLFPKLRARTTLARDLLDRLDEEHLHGEWLIRDLEHSLLAFEMMGEARREAFETDVARYADFYLAHMRVEEQKILPLAEQVLSKEDWAELDEAFATNRDPLTGTEVDAEYGVLFGRMLDSIPSPLRLALGRGMTSSLGPRQDLDDGFDALDVCHRQTLLTLGKLAALVTRLRRHGCDATARALASEIVTHFSTTARQHHEDEERHVFPRLLASDDPDIVQAVQRLQQDHGWLEEDWRELSAQLDAVASGQTWFDLDALQEAATVFIALSHEHIALEESCIYPQARARLRHAERREMGREMAARRRAAGAARAAG